MRIKVKSLLKKDAGVFILASIVYFPAYYLVGEIGWISFLCYILAIFGVIIAVSLAGWLIASD